MKRKLRKKEEKKNPNAAPKKERVRVDKMPRASEKINELMPLV